MLQFHKNCCQNILALRDQLLQFILYTTINSVLCWCSYSVQQYETHAAPPDLEPAEGRGAVYNYNNFSLPEAWGADNISL